VCSGTGGGLARLDQDGHWHTYTQATTNGGLPDKLVLTLAPGADGSLWVGTFFGGLARLDKEGHWQTYSRASTQGGLPADAVYALALGPDGALWAGTGVSLGVPSAGLARLAPR
jgi:ligand-binding sensor domain-containing protein